MSPEEALYAASVAFGRALRAANMRTSPESEIAFCRCLGEVDIRRRAQVYWAGRACFVQSPDEVRAFDVVFERLWEGRELEPARRGAEHGESDPRATGPQHGGE